MPSPHPDSFILPEMPFGESSDSGSNGTEADAASYEYSGSAGPVEFLPSVPVGEEGSDDSGRSLKHLPPVIPGESLPWMPIGEESDRSEEGSVDAQELASTEDIQGAIPQVVVEPASSPVRMGATLLPNTFLIDSSTAFNTWNSCTTPHPPHHCPERQVHGTPLRLPPMHRFPRSPHSLAQNWVQTWALKTGRRG